MRPEHGRTALEIKELSRGDKPVVTGYRDTGFAIGERRYDGALLLTPEACVAIAAERLEDVAAAQLAPILDADRDIEILLLGGGARIRFPPSRLRKALDSAGIAIEPMDSAAAARTFNILVMEERRVAALLIPVGTG